MNPKVLFVDDEPNILESIQQNLRKAKFQIITTNSVHHAFEILATSQVDVVVSDERMPTMSGHDFLTKVYNLYPKTVRLMLSGQASLTDVALAVNEGQIFRYLAKPTKPTQLIATINEAISVRQHLLYGGNNLQLASHSAKNLAELEECYPGITNVQRDDEGCILLEDTDLHEQNKAPETLYSLTIALELSHLTMHYQPVIDARSNAVNSYEALIRWRHPEHGLLMPDKFLHLAEGDSLSVEIGNWVIHEVCKQKRNWLNEGCSERTVAINISARHLEHPDFIQHLLSGVTKYNTNPESLRIEITEVHGLKNIHSAGETLNKVRALGIKISVDDFGMGYNSLSYLYKLPIDAIKIDRQFVAGIEKDAAAQKMVMALIGMAHDLGLQVTAEGVESKAQAQLLTYWGCDYLQGYFYGPPVATNELAT